MDIKLISITPKGTRKEFALTDSVTVLGRQPDCTLQVQLPEISRRHCELRMENKTVVVNDLGSANGTFVNGQKVRRQELKPGDVISLAEAIKFLVQIDGTPLQVDESKLRTGAGSTDVMPSPVPKKAPAPKPKPAGAPLKPPAGQKSAPPAKPPVAPKAAKDDAEDLLGESFFQDLDEEEEEK